MNQKITLEDNLSFKEFCEEIKRLPEDKIEEFKDKAREILAKRDINYSQEDLLNVMYFDLYEQDYRLLENAN